MNHIPAVVQYFLLYDIMLVLANAIKITVVLVSESDVRFQSE